MNIKCNTKIEALELASQLRKEYRGTDWRVSLIAPYFVGDHWYVRVS